MLHALSYDSGGSLCCAEYGCAGGFPVLVQHGMIASIRDGGLFSRLTAAGARVICIARPGYGQSSPRKMDALSEWGDIVALVVDALNLRQFDLLGISSGAPYCYSIGARLQNKVRHIFVLSGTPALCDPDVAKRWPYPIDRTADIPELQRLARQLFFSNLTATDVSRDDIHDSMMNDCYGIALDLKLRGRTWGFSLSEVSAPVYMQHSKMDTQVPFITAQMTAKLLPDCRLRAREQGEHFSAQVLDDFIEDVMLPPAVGGLPSRWS